MQYQDENGDTVTTFSAADRQAQLRRRRAAAESRSRRIFWIGTATLAAIVAAAVVIGFNVWNGTKRDVTITVTDKNRVCDSTGKSVSCYYLIYTTSGTFKDTDSLLNGKFASSDLYGQLRRGGQYEVEAQGWRIPWMSEYPNIVRIVKVVKEGSDGGN